MVKQAVLYITLPLCYAIIGMVIMIYFTGPLFKMADAKIAMIVTNGRPGSMEGDLLPDSSMKQGEIQQPVYGTKYGDILCETINLSVPLYYGDGEEELKKGGGHYIGSAMPGEKGTILIGGHDTTYFAPLEKLNKGEQIQIQTKYGEYAYLVKDIKIAAASDDTAYELKQTGEELILYTCYPFGEIASKREKRYFVFCERIVK